jgi:hypothetical protein
LKAHLLRETAKGTRELAQSKSKEKDLEAGLAELGDGRVKDPPGLVETGHD